MTPALKLGGFLAVLVIAFLAALAVGRAVGPVHSPAPPHGTHHQMSGR